MDQQTFNQIRELVYQQSGIKLSDAKKSLVTARLMKRLRALDLPDLKSYVEYLAQDREGGELVQLLDAISTNVTHFFREKDHFDVAADAFKQWLGEGQTRFRFWSAASSTGEEPYSLAMTFSEALSGGSRRPDLKILATDISTRVLQQCKRGQYEDERVKGISANLLGKYFAPCHIDNGRAGYEVDGNLKRMITFARLNLSAPPFPMKGPMDIVFCRNVMIYFDNPTRLRLLREIQRLLKPGGLLMVGHSESLSQELMGELQRVGASVYRKAA